METRLIYNAPRAIKIGDIFYVIQKRERKDFSSPCRVCNNEKKLTVNGITFDCPVCNGYHSRETVVSVNHFTVATVKVYEVRQKVSTDYWTLPNFDDLEFSIFRKRGHGYDGVLDNFKRDYFTSTVANNLNKLPDKEFLQRYSQDSYYNSCDRFIYDDYKIACAAADILNACEQEKLDAYNAEHGTLFVPQWKKSNDPKN